MRWVACAACEVRCVGCWGGVWGASCGGRGAAVRCVVCGVRCAVCGVWWARRYELCWARYGVRGVRGGSPAPRGRGWARPSRWSRQDSPRGPSRGAPSSPRCGSCERARATTVNTLRETDGTCERLGGEGGGARKATREEAAALLSAAGGQGGGGRQLKWSSAHVGPGGRRAGRVKVTRTRARAAVAHTHAQDGA
eukprot:2827468-Prymnesium_polylepis.1